MPKQESLPLPLIQVASMRATIRVWAGKCLAPGSRWHLALKWLMHTKWTIRTDRSQMSTNLSIAITWWAHLLNLWKILTSSKLTLGINHMMRLTTAITFSSHQTRILLTPIGLISPSRMHILTKLKIIMIQMKVWLLRKLRPQTLALKLLHFQIWMLNLTN
jgi:hypothetical protein